MNSSFDRTATLGAEIVLAVSCLLVPCWALAQVPNVPATKVARDPRLPIVLAEARRQNWRCLMRGHLQSRRRIQS
jgi:hypothetical protein